MRRIFMVIRIYDKNIPWYGFYEIKGMKGPVSGMIQQVLC